MNLLVTAGATREPIDAVRFLSNVSTGASGAALADSLKALGHTVALLHGEGAAAPSLVADVEVFSTAADLRSRLKRRLEGGAVDGVLMAAAVADYRPDSVFAGKLESGAGQLTVRLVRNEKVLQQLKSLSTRPLVVVGFKLTVGADDAARRNAVAAQFAAGGVDAVVQNDLDEIRREAVHRYRLYRSPAGEPVECLGPGGLAGALKDVFRTPC